MDYAVPDAAGVGPADPGLVTLRGADPLIDIPAAPHFFRRIRGLQFQVAGGALVANCLPISVIESVLGQANYVDPAVSGAAVVDSQVFLEAILPTQYEAILAQLLVDGLSPTDMFDSLSHAAAAIGKVLDTIDPSAIPAAYVLLPASLHAVEPIGGNVPNWVQALIAPPGGLTYGHLANGFGFTYGLSTVSFVCMGKYTSASRDNAASPTRAALTQIQNLARNARLLGTTATLTPSALMSWLNTTTPPEGLLFLEENPAGGLDRREQTIRDRDSLVYGPVEIKESLIARLVQAKPLRDDLHRITRVLGTGARHADAKVALQRLYRAISGSATARLVDIGGVHALESGLHNLTHGVGAAGVRSLPDRVDAVLRAKGSWTPGSSEVSSTSADVKSNVGGRADVYSDDLSIALSDNNWQNTEAQLTAELGAPVPNPVRLYDTIISSSILAARRLALGISDSASTPILRHSKPLAKALAYVKDWKAIASMYLVCDLVTLTTAVPSLISFRLGDKTSESLRKGAFNEVDWVQDILIPVRVAETPGIDVNQYPDGLLDPAVPPQLDLLIQRVSRLLGLPIQPPPAPPPPPLPLGGQAVVPPAPALFASLSSIVTTVGSEHLEIRGKPSPFNDDYVTQLNLFASRAWDEAAREFYYQVVTADNPAGRVLTSVLPPNSGAMGILNLMLLTKQQNQANAQTNRVQYQMLADYKAGRLTVRGNTSSSVGARSRSHSPTRSDGGLTSPTKKDSRVVPGSRYEELVRHSASGDKFWFVNPKNGSRISPVYDYDVLEQIAGKTRHELCFPFLLSTKSRGTRMEVCNMSHKRSHADASAAAHQVPFADFLDRVRQYFDWPGLIPPDDLGNFEGLNDFQRKTMRGKSPAPGDSRRSRLARQDKSKEERRDHRSHSRSSSRSQSNDRRRSRSSERRSPPPEPKVAGNLSPPSEKESPAHTDEPPQVSAKGAAMQTADKPPSALRPATGRRSRSPSESRSSKNDESSRLSNLDRHQGTNDKSPTASRAPADRRSRSRNDNRNVKADRSSLSPNQRHDRDSTRTKTQRAARWLPGLITSTLPGAKSVRVPHPSKVPLVDLTLPCAAMVRTVLFVATMASNSPVQLLLPKVGSHVPGRMHHAALSRDSAVRVGQSIATSMGFQTSDASLLCLPIFESVPIADGPDASVDRVVALPLPEGWSHAYVLPADSGWEWVALGAISCALVYSLASHAVQRLRTYSPHTDASVFWSLLSSDSRYRSGAREPRPVSRAAAKEAPSTVRASFGSDSTGRPPGDHDYPTIMPPPSDWAATKVRINSASAVLRKVFLDYPDSAYEAETIHGLADLIKPINEEEVPPYYKLPGNLPTFEHEELWYAPFSVRVQPPRTSWLDRKPPQPSPPPGFDPQSIADLLEPEWFSRLQEWYCDIGEWLLALSEVALDPHSECAQKVRRERPDILVIPQSGFVKSAQGIIWDLTGGKPVPLDFHAPFTSHLDLDVIREWYSRWPDYPDREIFSHLLEGVRFKADVPYQMVMQPHLESLSLGFVNLHKELIRLVEKGWYHCSTGPQFAPWNTLPNGTACRKLEPERPRRTTDGGAPRRGKRGAAWRVDEDGVRVLPLNILARWPPDDVRRGTLDVFYKEWRKRLTCRPKSPPVVHLADLCAPVDEDTASPSHHSPSPSRGSRASSGGEDVFRVLLVCSGPPSRPHSVAGYLRQHGALVVEIDISIDRVGHDLTKEEVLKDLEDDILDLVFHFVFFSPPCKSFSVAAARKGGRPCLRPLPNAWGSPCDVPKHWREYLEYHNTLIRGVIRLIRAARSAGLPWAIENPSSRANEHAIWKEYARWGSLWDIMDLEGLGSITDVTLGAGAQVDKGPGNPDSERLLEVTFAACAFGAPHQKMTTIRGSSCARVVFLRLCLHLCPHGRGKHQERAVGLDEFNCSRSAKAAAYSPRLAEEIAEGILDVLLSATAASYANKNNLAAVSSRRPTVGSRPSSPSLRQGGCVDVDITRQGPTPTLSNPFMLGPYGQTESLRPLAVAIYAEWLTQRTIPAKAMGGAIPVSPGQAELTGDDVLREVERLLKKHGSRSVFHLLCGRRCCGKLCHGHQLASLFEQVAESTGEFPLSKELKITVPEIMNDLAVLMYLSSRTGLFVYQFVSDIKDFFNQHLLAPEERYKVGLVTLDPRAVVAMQERLVETDPDLCNVAEYVLGYGIVNASNVGQRHAHLLVFIWYVTMLQDSAALVEAMCLAHPVLRSWMTSRSNLFDGSGSSTAAPSDSTRAIRFLQSRFWTASMYTDDCHQAFLGADLTLCGVVAWRKVTGSIRLTMAIIQKHGLGLQVTVQGLRFDTALGIVFVPEDKLLRALKAISDAIESRLSLLDYHSLLGLLQSLLFVVGLRKSHTFGLYAPFRGRLYIDPEEYLEASSAVRRCLREWSQHLSQRAGSSLAEAVAQLHHLKSNPLPNWVPVVFFLRSDAAKEGAGSSGLGGALGGEVWRYPSSGPLPVKFLTLPIAVLEFVAYVGTILAFAESLPSQALVVSEVDALSTPDALVEESAQSPLMQHIFAFLVSLPAYQRIRDKHLVAHIFGEANVMADAVSRDFLDVVQRLCQQLSLPLRVRQAPSDVGELLERLLELQQDVDHQHSQTHRKRRQRSDNEDGDGPSGTSTPPLRFSGEPARWWPTSTNILISHTNRSMPSLASALPSFSAAQLSTRPMSAPPLNTPSLSVQPVFALPSVSVPLSQPVNDPVSAHAVSLLLADESRLALRPTAFTLDSLCAELYDPFSAQPARTSAGQRSAWKHWDAWCRVMRPDDPQPWRLTRHTTDAEFHREAVLQAGFLRYCHVRQSARPRNGRKAALVSSAVKTLCHIRKMHKDRGYPMCSSHLVTVQVRRLSMEYKSKFGVADFVPRRKEPFTRYILQDILAAPQGLNLGRGWLLDWHSFAGNSLRAMVCTLAQAGFRKGEVTVPRNGQQCDADCLSRASLRFYLRGRMYAASDAPSEYLASLRLGDFAVLIPPPSKSDPFDMVWGGEPIWLPFQASEPLCACAALADLVRNYPVSSSAAAHTALFSSNAFSPFVGPCLDLALQRLLQHILPAVTASLYSWHSARIFLATVLLESGASHAQIQALCRWQTDASIKIYSRLSATKYAFLLNAAMSQQVNAARAQNLATAVPFIDIMDILRSSAERNQVRGLELAATTEMLDIDPHPDDDADVEENDVSLRPDSSGLTPQAPRTSTFPQATAPAPAAASAPVSPASVPSRARARSDALGIVRLPRSRSNTPTPGQRIKIYWTGMKQWFTGTCTSSRMSDGRCLSRIYYDRSPPWPPHAFWHDMSVEFWTAAHVPTPPPKRTRHSSNTPAPSPQRARRNIQTRGSQH